MYAQHNGIKINMIDAPGLMILLRVIGPTR